MTKNHTPIVATTLNRPVATLSISASICCSVDEGELSTAYDECGGGGGAPGDEGVVDVGGGGVRRENSEGEGEINDKYWSNTCKMTRTYVRCEQTQFAVITYLSYSVTTSVPCDRSCQLLQ